MMCQGLSKRRQLHFFKYTQLDMEYEVNLNKNYFILDAAAASLVLHDDLRDHGGSRHAAQGLQPPPRQERAPPASPAAPAHPAATQTSPQNIRHEGQ